ncbi:hypothetical protein L1049_024572 [Liquidambar formosana]|uniref:SAM-dependent MTase RsmB/NOP-type domain-containing protein n=1 Tax=Liquidambar formosana TaxID=63359 RepID=A0AAP0RV47_LIQFO
MEETSTLPLPDAFLDFLNENGLDPSIYTATDSTPRYIRLKPGCEACVEEIEAEIKCKLEKVGWLPDFFSLPPDIQIANSNAYREGKIYGIDAASGAAVSALNISEGDHVLDLCAAPGAKLCMILDLLGNSGTVTGVDVTRHRLAACRTLLQKYALGDRCRLFVADGTTFSLIPVRVHSDSKSWVQDPELIFYGQHSGVVGLSKRELYQTVCENDASSCGYDKVLVDAECTHDGSIRHIQKFEHWGWKTLQRRVLNAERTDSLTVLQLQLLSNGFRLLKVGGSLVYSTCSLTVAQNEDVVERFLLENASAELQDVEAAKNWPCRSGRIWKTLRFDPLTSQTSGLFVAKADAASVAVSMMLRNSNAESSHCRVPQRYNKPNPALASWQIRSIGFSSTKAIEMGLEYFLFHDTLYTMTIETELLPQAKLVLLEL